MNSLGINELSDRLLEIIRRRPEHNYTDTYLSKKLTCAKDDIVEAVHLLRDAGYKILSGRNSTFVFRSAPDFLLAPEITHGLTTKKFGREIFAYKSVQSTNIIATRLANTQAPEGTIVVAEAQTKGKGRLGRGWFSLQHKGIYVSIILYPDIPPMRAPGLSLMAAVSLADTIAHLDAIEVRLKWPNDCLINGRKVAGILTEVSSDLDNVHHAVIGVGINVNHRRQDFPDDIRKSATSLRAELKEKMRRVELLQMFLRNLEKDYAQFKKSGLKNIKKRFLKYATVFGKTIRLDAKGIVISGKAVDIDDNGALVVETPEGKKSFGAGEVTVVKMR